MSVKIMSRVWEKSLQKGSPLLTLLALADWANDYGICWYGMNKLHKKTRLSDRNVQRIVHALNDTRDLFICDQCADYGTNGYLVLTGMNCAEIMESLMQPPLNYPKLDAERKANELFNRPNKQIKVGGDKLSGVTNTVKKRANLSPNTLEEKRNDSPDGDSPTSKQSENKEKSARAPQPHMVPIVAYVEAVGNETLPPDFSFGSFSRFSKNLAQGGVTELEATQAGGLIRTWLISSQLTISMEWTVSEVTRLFRLSLLMASRGVTSATLETFMQECYADSFWSGKVINLKYIADHITANNAQPKPAAPEWTYDPERPGVKIRKTS